MKRLIEKIKKIDKNYLLIFFLSILLISPLLTKLYFWGHDTGYHIANVLAMSENINFHSLSHLKILPMIAHNFGYGSAIFYPQLAHIVASIFYVLIKPLGWTVFTSIKLTDFVCVFLSNALMYKLLKTVTKDKKLSLISSLFYMTSAYKIYDYIVRDAIAETFIFIFLPIIFLGIYYLLNKEYKKFYFYFVLGYVGLIQSHLIMTIYVTIFLAIILLCNFKKIWKKEIIKRFVIATITVILISLPFIIPLLEHKLFGSYVVFLKDSMANPWGTQGNGLSYHFLIGNAKEIGYHFLNLIALGLAIFLVIKLKKEKKGKKDFFLITGLVCTFLGIWMSSILFPWFLLPDFLQLIQFPWRLGTMTAFGLSILSYYAFIRCQKKQKLILGLSVLSCFIISLFCLANQSYQKIEVAYYDLSWYGMGWQQEYLPVKTKENYDYFENRDSQIHIESGKAEIEIIEDETPNLKFKVANVSNATLELPRIYYFGYTIKNEKNENIPYRENEKGFIEIEVPEEGILELTYTGTKLAKIGNAISIITIIGFILCLLWKRGSKNEERKNKYSSILL